MVKPSIRNHEKVGIIMEANEKMMEACQIYYAQVQQNAMLAADEATYISRTLDRLVAACEADIEELAAVTTDEEFEMKDDERMTRIEAIYARTLENYAFYQAFSSSAEILSLGRIKEKMDTEKSRELYRLNTEGL